MQEFGKVSRGHRCLEAEDWSGQGQVWL